MNNDSGGPSRWVEEIAIGHGLDSHESLEMRHGANFGNAELPGVRHASEFHAAREHSRFSEARHVQEINEEGNDPQAQLLPRRVPDPRHTHQASEYRNPLQHGNLDASYQPVRKSVRRDVFETTFHMLLPERLTKIPDLKVYVVFGVDNDDWEWDQFPMRNVGHPMHWVSNRLEVPRQLIERSFMFLATKNSSSLQRFVKRRDEQMLWEYDPDECYPRIAEIIPHNFCFPKDPRQIVPVREMVVKMTHPQMFSVYIEALSNGITDLQSLGNALLQFECLLDDCVTFQSAKHTVPSLEINDTIQHFSKLCERVQNEENEENEGEQHEMLVPVFLAIVGAALCRNLRSKPDVWEVAAITSHDVKRRFGRKSKNDSSSKVPEACAVLLSLFDSFKVFSEPQDVVNHLPACALDWLRGDRDKVGYESGVFTMVSHSSRYSFEWMKQMHGLWLACGDLDFLRVFSVTWEAAEYSMYVKAGEQTADRPQGPINVLNSTEYKAAVDSLLDSGIVHENGNRDVVGGVLDAVLFTAPALDSLSYLISNMTLRNEIMGNQNLALRFSQSFRGRGLGRTVDELLEFWKQHVHLDADSVDQSEGVGKDKEGGGSVDQDREVVVGVLAEVYRELCIDLLEGMHEKDEKQQEAYMNLIADGIIFREGIASLFNFLQSGPGSSTSVGRNWPAFLLDRLFPNLLQTSLKEGLSEGLVDICIDWLGQKMVRLAAMQERAQFEDSDFSLGSQIQGAVEKGIKFVNKLFTGWKDQREAGESGLDGNCNGDGGMTRRACWPFVLVQELITSVPELIGSNVAVTVLDALVERCQWYLMQLPHLAVLAATSDISSMDNERLKQAFLEIARGVILGSGDNEPCVLDVESAIDSFLAVSCGRDGDHPDPNDLIPVSIHSEVTAALVLTILNALHTSGYDLENVHDVIKGQLLWRILFCLKMEGDFTANAEIAAHPLRSRGLKTVQKLAQDLRLESVSVQEVEGILSVRDDALLLFQDLKEHNVAGLENLEEMLLTAEGHIEQHKTKMESLDLFLKCICRPLKATDVENYEQLLHRTRLAFPTLGLSDIRGRQHWGFLYQILNTAQKVPRDYFTSTVFDSAVQLLGQEIQNSTRVVADCSVDKIEANFSLLWYSFFAGEKATVKDARMLLTSERKADLEKELEIAQKNIPKLKGMQPTFPVAKLKFYVQLVEDESTLMLHKGQILNELQNLFDLEYSDESQALQEAIQFINDHRDEDNADLLQLTRAYELIEESLGGLVDRLDVLVQLASGWELVAFVKEVRYEDMRKLIDAVEEHSDTFVRENTVADFISVKRFISQVLDIRATSLLQFLSKIATAVEMQEDSQDALSMKLMVCNENLYGLKSLYARVANRGEMTREVITDAVNRGEFLLQIHREGKFDRTKVLAIDRGKGKLAMYSLSQLHDFRSRALLLVNSNKAVTEQASSEGSGGVHDVFSCFIEYVNLITVIADLSDSLGNLGHFDYLNWSRVLCSTSPTASSVVKESLFEVQHELFHALEDWQKVLSGARKEFYALNFLRAKQIQMLWDVCTSAGDPEAVFDALCSSQLLHSLLAIMPCERSMSTSFPALNVKDADECPSADRIRKVGNWLEGILHEQCSEGIASRAITDHVKYMHANSHVDLGDFLLVQVEEGSHLANVILSLYAGVGTFPAPGEIVICNKATDWEDVDLLLARCCYSNGTFREGRLFCLAGVELLDFALQNKLVERLQQLERDRAGELSYPMWKLAILVTDDGGSHLVDQFPEKVRRMGGLSNADVGHLFGEHCKTHGPDVTVVTSDTAGLGKTTFIKESVPTGWLIPVQVEGPIDCSLLLGVFREQIGKLPHSNVSPPRGLVIDLSMVSDVQVLDTFLFQLLAVNHVTSGLEALFFNHSNCHVFIEVANTLADELRSGLHFLNCAEQCVAQSLGKKTDRESGFRSVNLTWNLRKLMVSKTPDSDSWLVFRYLRALNTGILEQEELPEHSVNPYVTVGMCQDLLEMYFLGRRVDNRAHSFSYINTFISVFAWQLRSFSKSVFFQIETQMFMVDNAKCRVSVVQALLASAKQFALESATAAAISQSEQVRLQGLPQERQMLERVRKMVRWEDNDHLLVLFNQADGQSITTLFNDMSRIPASVRDVLDSQRQGNAGSFDFKRMRQQELLGRLELILGKSVNSVSAVHAYALTPDNFMKVVLIHTRIQAHVPVVLLGETGCGKTSLVKFLASIQGVNFHVLNFHAGTTAQEIREFILEKETVAGKCPLSATNDPAGKVWVFLDEINTCEHMGLVNHIVTHRMLDGRLLDPGLVVLAACNPYRYKDKEIQTSGLQGKRRNPNHAELVYSVHPLPESMLAFVWDYGTLSNSDEERYIMAMVGNCFPTKNNMVVDLLSLSQRFVRRVETDWSVSLRDVKRWLRLFNWFRMHLKDRPAAVRGKCRASWIDAISLGGDYEINRRACVLALVLCYYVRLGTEELRNQYRMRVLSIFAQHNLGMPSIDFMNIMREEQCDYIRRMELPPGTAQNHALLENIFVSMVCILNKIPVFMVGKPGCSKSLSLQLINSNLRGQDSRDPFFRKLPQVFFVSFQGSESSTSDGILRVFEKAERYLDEGRVVPVVLLDEVGLAEISPHNPLKVLHSLLEPGYPKETPDIAVVGISNWALDAAKMNRAIVLSRPEPDVQDLTDTVRTIGEAALGQQPPQQILSQMEGIARAYHDYVTNQARNNFHGLRDFYSLVKCLCLRPAENSEHSEKNPVKEIQLSEEQLIMAFCRNFGGLPKNQTLDTLGGFLRQVCVMSVSELPPVRRVVRESLRDKAARHLLLVTNGDSAIDVLQNYVVPDKEMVVIYGSMFPDDANDDYSYRVLSRIILCMESGTCLVLKDLDAIYGSLYDMLNQNYTVVGGRRHCRVALGPYSNPMCTVHPDFRCIVLMDQTQVDQADPPFLNRFEKQLLGFGHVMDSNLRRIGNELSNWVNDISTVSLQSYARYQGVFGQGGAQSRDFGPASMFLGFHEDTIPSLVLMHARTESSKDGIVGACKQSLMEVATLDGIIRAMYSKLATAYPNEVKYWVAAYFARNQFSISQIMLKELACAHQDSKSQPTSESENDGCNAVRILVMTYSPIYMRLTNLVGNGVVCQDYKLQAFRSEEELSTVIQKFYENTSPGAPTLLLLQSATSQDNRIIQLARFLINHHRSEFLARYKNSTPPAPRHAWLVVHAQKNWVSGELGRHTGWQINFLCGWKQYTVSSLDGSDANVVKFLNRSVVDVLSSDIYPIRQVLEKVILSSFLTIKYPEGMDSITHVYDLMDRITSDSELMDRLVERVMKDVQLKVGRCEWEVVIACSHQRLASSGSLLRSIQLFIEENVRVALSKLIFVTEKECGFKSYVSMGEEMQEIWRELFMDHRVVNVEDILDAVSAEQYPVGHQLHCTLPFSGIFFRQIESHQDFYTGRMSEGGPGHAPSSAKQRSQFADSLRQQIALRVETTMHADIGSICRSHEEQYKQDFVQWLSRGHAPTLPHDCSAFSKVMLSLLNLERNRHGSVTQGIASLLSTMTPLRGTDPVSLHIFWWENSELVLAITRIVEACEIVGFEMGAESLKDLGSAFNQDILCACIKSILPQKGVLKSYGDVREWHGKCSMFLEALSVMDSQISGQCRVLLNGLQVMHSMISVGLIFESKFSMVVHAACRLTNTCSNGADLMTSTRGVNLVLETSKTLLGEVASKLGRQTRCSEKVGEDDLEGLDQAVQSFVASFCRRSIRERTTEIGAIKTICAYVFSSPPPKFAFSVVDGLLVRCRAEASNFPMALLGDASTTGGSKNEVSDGKLRLAHMLLLVMTTPQAINAVRSTTLECLCSIVNDSAVFEAPSLSLISDVVQLVVFDSMTLDLFRNSNIWFDKQVYVLFEEAFSVVCNDEASSNFQVVIAIGLLRSLLDVLGRAIAKKKGHIVRSPLLSMVDRNVGKVGSRAEALKIYLLKTLPKEGLHMSQVRLVCRSLGESQALTCVKDLRWDCLEANQKVEFNPFRSLKHYNQAEHALLNAMSCDSTAHEDLLELLRNGRHDIEICQALIAAVVMLLYVPRGWRLLQECEYSLVSFLRSQKFGALKHWRDADILLAFAENQFPVSGTMFDLNPGMGAEELQHVLLTVHLMVVFGIGQRDNCLSTLFQLPSTVPKIFILAMPSDEMRTLLNALARGGEAVTRYKCQRCGYLYVVGNCGAAVGVGVCPSCRRPIGKAADQVRLDSAPQGFRTEQHVQGYVSEPPSPSMSHCHRELTPVAYRILHLFGHLLMWCGSFMGEQQGQMLITMTGQVDVGAARAFIQNHVQTDLRILGDILMVSCERMVVMLHAMVAKLEKRPFDVSRRMLDAKMRTEWEVDFMRTVVLPVVSDRRAAVTSYLREVQGENKSMLSEMMYERETTPSPKSLPHLLRTRTAITLEGLFSFFYGREHHAKTYPLLHIFFQSVGQNFGDSVVHVHHLCALKNWALAVQSVLGKRISREEANRLTVGEFLKQRASWKLQSAFEKFCKAWNAVRNLTNRFECTEFPRGIPPMSMQMPISSCCYEKRDAGIYLCALIHHLVDLHNGFLEMCMPLAMAIRHLLTRVECHDGIFQFQRRSLTNISMSDTMCVDKKAFESRIVGAEVGSCHLEYGQGQDVMFDLRQTEMEVARLCLDGKCMIDVGHMPEMDYQHEGFHSHATILSDVSEKVPQEGLSPDRLSSLLSNPAISENPADTLGALDVAVAFIKQTGANPSHTLEQYSLAWIQDAHSKHILTAPPLSTVHLKHLICVYEGIEDILAGTAIHSVNDLYASRLPESVKEDVLRVVKVDLTGSGLSDELGNGPISVSAFCLVLRKFAFRFLLSARDRLRGDIPVKYYLSDERCVRWPQGSVQIEDGQSVDDVLERQLPDSFLVMHVKGVYDLLCQLQWAEQLGH